MIKENFVRLFEDGFRKNWDLKAYTNYGEDVTLTYAQVAEKIAKLHLLFEQAEIKRNDKIALIGKNNSNWAITYLATVTYGAVIVPILQDFSPNDILHIVNHSESKALFASDYIWENLTEDSLMTVKAVFSLADFGLITLINQPEATLLEESESKDCIIAPINPAKLSHSYINGLFAEKYSNDFHKDCVRYVDKHNSEVVCISYTSGTTGFSKGVMLTGNNFAGNMIFGKRSKLLAPEYNIVAFLPLAHAYGCAFDFLTSTYMGSHIHFIGRTPSAKILLNAFAEIRPNIIFCVPLIIEKIYKKQIQPLLEKPSMRWVLSIPLLDQTVLGQIRKKMMDAFGGNFSQIVIGGAPLNAEVEDFFHKIKFPFTVGYGMTECAPLISFSHAGDFVPKSAGKVLDIMEVKIENPDPATGIGEILVRGENVMAGYYKNEAATNEVFDKEGWMRTGDLGTVDSNGNIFIRGRNKTMILSANGQNIYPEVLEAKLNNMPFVMESLVIESKGRLLALVCPDYETVDAAGLTRKQLEDVMEDNRKALNQMASTYENIASIQLYPNEFEKTPKKSIKRYLYTTTGF